MNRLGQETSPYLLQHKDNPVHWWAWGPEALAEAKRTGKPILLSVGYAACHWCHVMAHESFEDQATADVMNGLYINVKVDREERPDIDAIYMNALHALGEQGGWPLTMFLDSEARPFFGGTYFPKQAQYGRPAFVTVLLQIAQIYQNEPERVRHNVEGLMAALSRKSPDHKGDRAGDSLIRHLVDRLVQASDSEHGGLRGAPKFPQWNALWLLWRGAIRYGQDGAKDAVVTTLRNICQGGIYDHLGGGFSRYSVDEYWLVPHFEKMLYDNALLIDLMTEVWRETREPLLARRIDETVGWLAREMTVPGGGFAASLDADSEGEEGKFYVWTAQEIVDVLGPADAAFFGKVYGVTAGGNFEGHTILNRLDHLDLLSDDEERRLDALRAKLLARRDSRVRPGFDDKVLADWNGLMIAALARAGIVFGKPAWLDMAKAAFAFVSRAMARDGERLWHSTREGKVSAPATASDYAAMTWAALRLYQAVGGETYLEAAKRWTAVLDRDHWDGGSGGYYTAASDTSDVIVRLKSAHDDAVPSANAIALQNLVSLAALTGDTTFQDRAEKLYGAFQGDIARSPAGHCGVLAQSFDLSSLMQVVVTARSGDGGALQAAVHALSLPGAIEIKGSAAAMEIAVLSEKFAVSAGAAAFVCTGPVCSEPVIEPNVLKQRLIEARSSGLA